MALGFTTISDQIRSISFPEVDLVVGIATGGIIPASLVAFHLGLPLRIVHLNYRDEENVPRYAAPKLLQKIDEPLTGKRILLVDDVCVSGKTLEAARGLFEQCEVSTFVLKGSADYSAFPDISTCVIWPWKG